VYRGVLNGFAAVMTDSQVGALRDDIDVDCLSEDAQVTLD
jgi:Peptidase inhibitor I9